MNDFRVRTRTSKNPRQIWRTRALLLAFLGLSVVGCSSGLDGVGTQPLVFPWKGQFGDPALGIGGTTVAIAIDTNYHIGQDIFEYYNLDQDRVEVWLSDAEGAVEFDDIEVISRGVFRLDIPDSSERGKTAPGSFITVALFDLPNANDVTFNAPIYPINANLIVKFDGVTKYSPAFQVTGEDGVSNPINDTPFLPPEAFIGSLASQRMIRIQGKRLGPGETEGKFDPNQPPIGAIEFDLEINALCMGTEVRAYPATEATHATALVGPLTLIGGAIGPVQSMKVVMIDPKGIEMVFVADIPAFPGLNDETLAGQGPILDLAVGSAGANGCDLSNSALTEIRNLFVYDVDGVEILSILGTVLTDTESAPDDAAALRLYFVEGA